MMDTDEISDTDRSMSVSKRERSYKCQRCLNHDILVSRKGHQCPYKECICSGCDLNNLRSKLMTILRERGLNHSEVFMTKKAGRKQHCMLCSFHGERVELRGHKRNCPWAKCECDLCTVGRHYRDTMAKQTKHRRSQRKPTIVDHRPLPVSALKIHANGPSKRVVMKHDWRRRVQASRSGRQPEMERDESEFDQQPKEANEICTPTQSTADNGGHWPMRANAAQAILHMLQYPTPVLPNSGPVLAANIINCPIPAHILTAPMSAHFAMQHQQAAEMAAFLSARRFGSFHPNIFTNPGQCTNCQPALIDCHSNHAYPKTDQQTTTLRLPTFLNTPTTVSSFNEFWAVNAPHFFIQ